MRDEIRKSSRVSRLFGLAAMLSLVMAPSASPAQSVGTTAQQAPVPTYSVAPVVSAGMAAANQLPQDIRIMQRILSTALGEVEAPELPSALREEGAPDAGGGAGILEAELARAVRMAPRFRASYIGGRDISGFYMQGYGYLFTVNWRVSGALGRNDELYVARATELASLASRAGAASTSSQETEARAADEARRTLEAERQRVEEQRDLWREWSAEYRSRLAQELAGVLAQYGATLNRAQPDESITFIADFGGGEAETVTATVRRGALSGVGGEDNLDVVQLARGEAEISEAMRTELKIMSAIIDSSLQGEAGHETTAVYTVRGWSIGGGDSFQYVPGYGVLFRKPARLNLATRVIQSVSPSRSGSVVGVQSLRDRIDQSTEEQRESYAEHLEALRASTAEVFSTYGPTLTHLGSDEWVGVYYDVGSAAGLLQGGISNFLVQARMDDIRQAATQSDPAGWLAERLVTNERQD